MERGLSCPKCGSQNPSGYRFCGSCGDRLPASCPRCGGSVATEDIFCGSCGASLGSGMHKAEPRPCSEGHLEKAGSLIESARMYDKTLVFDKYPEMKAVAKPNLLPLWDKLVTIACVGCAFAEIADTVPEGDQRGIAYAVEKKIESWQHGSWVQLAALVAELEKMTDKGTDIACRIGGWILRNLRDEDKSSKELEKLASSSELATAVGLLIVGGFHDWWIEE